MEGDTHSTQGLGMDHSTQGLGMNIYLGAYVFCLPNLFNSTLWSECLHLFKAHMLKFEYQYNCIRAFGKCLGDEGEALMNGISVLRKKLQRSPHTFRHMRIWEVCGLEAGPPPHSAGALIPDLQPPELCLFRSPILLVFVIAARSD